MNSKIVEAIYKAYADKMKKKIKTRFYEEDMDRLHDFVVEMLNKKDLKEEGAISYMTEYVAKRSRYNRKIDQIICFTESDIVPVELNTPEDNYLNKQLAAIHKEICESFSFSEEIFNGTLTKNNYNNARLTLMRKRDKGLKVEFSDIKGESVGYGDIEE